MPLGDGFRGRTILQLVRLRREEDMPDIGLQAPCPRAMLERIRHQLVEQRRYRDNEIPVRNEAGNTGGTAAVCSSLFIGALTDEKGLFLILLNDINAHCGMDYILRLRLKHLPSFLSFLLYKIIFIVIMLSQKK